MIKVPAILAGLHQMAIGGSRLANIKGHISFPCPCDEECIMGHSFPMNSASTLEYRAGIIEF